MEEYFQNSKKGNLAVYTLIFENFFPEFNSPRFPAGSLNPFWTSHPINHCTLKSKMASILLEVMVAFKDISAILPTSLSSRHFIIRQSYAFRLIIKNEDLAKHLSLMHQSIETPAPPTPGT